MIVNDGSWVIEWVSTAGVPAIAGWFISWKIPSFEMDEN